jgi:tetratricopeptide (TPR) repeat protein
VIATSRALLRIDGERDYAVDPLPEPDAVELSRERAAVSEPEEAVRAICRRLDGLPLAVELAAARTRLLPPPQLLERLERTLPMLTGGRRDAPARQQTLRATIEWSFDLLPSDEQRLFTRLASFVGSFTVAAAEAVCDAELDALVSLLEKSLLRRWESGRLGMLETIAEFATERLAESREADGIRRRHAHYFLALAESANLSVEALGRGPQRHDLVLPEQHNLRAALDWADDADIELGLRLALAVENLWITHDPAEGMRRFEALLSRADEVDPILRARALRDYGGTAQMAGDPERAEQAYAESGELFQAAGDEAGSATIVFRFGVAAAWRGDFGRARSLYEESRVTFRRLDDAIGELQVLGNLGALEFNQGHPERAIELIEQSLELARKVGWVWWETSQLANLGEIALVVGRTADGERYARETLALARETGDREVMVYALGQLVWVATEAADDERAALLWGAIEAEEARHALPRWRMDRDLYASHLPQVVPQVPTLTLEEAADYALA